MTLVCLFITCMKLLIRCKCVTYIDKPDSLYSCVQVNHLEPWEKGSRKTAGQTGMCGGVSLPISYLSDAMLRPGHFCTLNKITSCVELSVDPIKLQWCSIAIDSDSRKCCFRELTRRTSIQSTASHGDDLSSPAVSFLGVFFTATTN